MKKTRKGKRLPEILTPGEQEKIFSLLENNSPRERRNRAILRVFLDCGLRAAELINLKHRDIDTNLCRLWVREGKGGKDRVLWFGTLTREALQDYFGEKIYAPDRPVFSALSGAEPLCGRWLRYFVRNLVSRAGISKRISVHSLRHTFACDLYAKTRDLLLVKDALGHSDIGTTTIYARLVNHELEAALKNFREET